MVRKATHCQRCHSRPPIQSSIRIQSSSSRKAALRRRQRPVCAQHRLLAAALYDCHRQIVNDTSSARAVMHVLSWATLAVCTHQCISQYLYILRLGRRPTSPSTKCTKPPGSARCKIKSENLPFFVRLPTIMQSRGQQPQVFHMRCEQAAALHTAASIVHACASTHTGRLNKLQSAAAQISDSCFKLPA